MKKHARRLCYHISMSETGVDILVVILLILANGLFAMSELALVSARKVRLQQRADDGDKHAQVALALANTPTRFLSTVQIGISLIGVLAGAVGGATLADQLAVPLSRIPALAPYAHGLALALIVIAITYLSLVIGELIPKRIALNNPEGVAVSVAGLMRFLSTLAAPLVALLSVSTEAGLRLLGIQPSREPIVTEEEIRVLMEQGTQGGVFEEAEQDMVESVFRLGDRRVGAIMTPRTEIIWLDLNEPYDKNLRTVLDSEHSLFPVSQGSLDNVIGVLRAKDLLGSLAGVDRPVDLRTLARPPLFVPESMTALTVLENLRTSGIHMALVIDEYGGLMGMITLFDVLQSIVGAIQGHGPEEEQQVVQREDGSWLMDGLLPVDVLKEILDLDDLPEENRVGYQTLGGFLMAMVGNIPNTGQYFDWDGWRFEVVDMDGRRVDKVLVRRTETG